MTKNRFPLFLIAISLLVIAALIGTYKFFFFYNEADQKEYYALIEQSDPNKSAQSTPYVAKQTHDRVRKDLWYLKDGQRLQASISSAHSALIMDRHDETTEIIEQMNDMTCMMQEELYSVLKNGEKVTQLADGTWILRGSSRENSTPILLSEVPMPMQLIRYLEANEAAYHYQTDKLVAQKVKIKRFIAPGHILVDSLEGVEPLISGIAESIEFTLSDNGPEFSAQQLKATFQTTKGLP